jgi:hypothetical protein
VSGPRLTPACNLAASAGDTTCSRAWRTATNGFSACMMRAMYAKRTCIPRMM